jgi:hypothetical protein
MLGGANGGHLALRSGEGEKQHILYLLCGSLGSLLSVFWVDYLVCNPRNLLHSGAWSLYDGQRLELVSLWLLHVMCFEQF